MAVIHPSGAGIGPGDAHARHGWRAAAITGAVLVCLAIVVPFGLRALDQDHASVSPGSAAPSRPAGVTPATHHASGRDPALGARGDLPGLLPAGSAVSEGAHVRVGDVTTGSMRRTPSGWQVFVRWNGHLQPVATTGPVSLREGTTWVARSGLLYTRVPTGVAGRFTVYGWEPLGGSAYTAPTLTATLLGPVCFNSTFTDYGTCAKG